LHAVARGAANSGGIFAVTLPEIRQRREAERCVGRLVALALADGC
jgi:hypothetical protein